MFFIRVSSAAWQTEVQRNLTSFLDRWYNASATFANLGINLWEYDAMPKNLLTFITFLRVGSSFTATTSFGLGLTPSAVIT